MARPQIAFWFEFASTYSYLSAMRVEQVAADHDVEVIWRPFLLGPIFAAQSWDSSPFNLYPAKGRYMWRDMERICAARGLPFVRPEVFPQNGLLAARVALAAKERMPAFVGAVYHAQFGEGADIAQPATVEACLKVAGLSPDLMELAQSAENKLALRQQTEAAVSHGVFGAPSFLVNDELFWGDDRMEQALAWASTHPS